MRARSGFRDPRETARALERRLRHYTRPALLVCDELGYLAYDARAADLLFQLVSRRYEHRSLLITTNLPFKHWDTVFPNASCAVALIDRLTHHVEILVLEGRSYRRREAELTQQQRKRRRPRRDNPTDSRDPTPVDEPPRSSATCSTAPPRSARPNGRRAGVRAGDKWEEPLRQQYHAEGVDPGGRAPLTPQRALGVQRYRRGTPAERQAEPRRRRGAADRHAGGDFQSLCGAVAGTERRSGRRDPAETTTQAQGPTAARGRAAPGDVGRSAEHDEAEAPGAGGEATRPAARGDRADRLRRCRSSPRQRRPAGPSGGRRTRSRPPASRGAPTCRRRWK